MANKTSPVFKDAILAAAAVQLAEDGETSPTAIARQLGGGVKMRTVQGIIRRNSEILQERVPLKVPGLLASWRYVHQSTLADLYQRDQSGTLTPSARRELTWTMGVSNDKILNLLGMPTAHVALSSAEDVPSRDRAAVASSALLRAVQGGTK